MFIGTDQFSMNASATGFVSVVGSGFFRLVVNTLAGLQARVTYTYNVAPVCNLSISSSALTCSNSATTSVGVDGSGSSDESALSYSWTSTCPNSNAAALSTASGNLSFSSYNDTSPTAGLICGVTLTVSDGQLSSSCSQNLTVSACTFDCNNQIGGTATLDRCGVCGGDNSSCTRAATAASDCAGIAGGTQKIDSCGVCGGDGSLCVDTSLPAPDCKGVRGGSSTYDVCGVCGGAGNTCTPPTIVVSGGMTPPTVYCEKGGQVYTFDRCGVCGGDGQSCLGCYRRDTTAVSASLDSNALSQKGVMLQSVYYYQKLKGSRKYARAVRAEAQALYAKLWGLAWARGFETQTCSNTTYCALSSNQDLVSTVSSASSEFITSLAAAHKSVRRQDKQRKYNRRLKKLEERMAALHAENLRLVQILPVQASCR